MPAISAKAAISWARVPQELVGLDVGWAVVGTGDHKEIAKTKLDESTTLRLLQVEALTPEFEAIMKQHKR